MSSCTKKIGILLTNLGSPEDVSYFSVRRYLRDFLSDQRVIENNSLLWKAILYGFVLTIRPFKTSQSYKKIWHPHHCESPLRLFTRWQAEALNKRFNDADNVTVKWGMRYGTPSLHQALEELHDVGCQFILHMPLYPQYSSPTTATANDYLFKALMKYRVQPAIRTLPSFPTDKTFIQAVSDTIREKQKESPIHFEKILISFHGLPQSYIDKGDPYYEECQQTAKAIRENMGHSEEYMPLSFQSRFGPTRWLTPYTVDMVEKLAQQGIKHIGVVMPAFFTDCLETLEEIKLQVRDHFVRAGGETLTTIPCLNATKSAIDVLEHLARRELSGWLEQ